MNSARLDMNSPGAVATSNSRAPFGGFYHLVGLSRSGSCTWFCSRWRRLFWLILSLPPSRSLQSTLSAQPSPWAPHPLDPNSRFPLWTPFTSFSSSAQRWLRQAKPSAISLASSWLALLQWSSSWSSSWHRLRGMVFPILSISGRSSLAYWNSLERSLYPVSRSVHCPVCLVSISLSMEAL